MRRKVIQIADSTQLISLPRKWAVRNNIKKGDELNVSEAGSDLVVSHDGTKIVEKVTADFDKFSPLTAKCALDVLHKCGYDEIEITYTDKEVFKTIQERLLQLIGCDVVEQTDRRVLIKDITKGSLETEFDSLFRRVFMVTISMATNSFASIKEGKYHVLAEYATSESTNNKLVNYCQRILTKQGLSNNKKAPLYYVVLWYLESIADDYRDILNKISEKKGLKLSKEFVQLYEDIKDYFSLFYKVFYSYSRSSLDKLYQERGTLIKRGEALLKSKKDESDIVWLLISIPHKIFDILPTISVISAL